MQEYNRLRITGDFGSKQDNMLSQFPGMCLDNGILSSKCMSVLQLLIPSGDGKR